MKRLFFLLVVFFCCLSFIKLNAQPHHHTNAALPVFFKDKNNDSIRVVYIWNANRMREETKDSATKLQSLIGDVEMQQDNTYFYCDSVVINQSENIVEAFGKVHINDSDTTNIYSQYMKYYVDNKFVVFQKKVTMTDGNGTLYTDDLNYDMKQRIGTYTNGGKVINGSSVLTSKEGNYYAETKDIYFKKDVVLKDPAYDLKTDSLLYNTQTQIATFITKTYIRDSSGSNITTKAGNYDLKHHNAYFTERPVINQGPQKITGNLVKFDDKTGVSYANGNAVFVDTLEGISILANSLIADRKTKTFLATENPLMILKQDNDSLYISADTLFSGKLSDLLTADSIRRHNDSLRLDAIRISDSLHSDSIRLSNAKLLDSLKNYYEFIAKEHKRKNDSLIAAGMIMPDTAIMNNTRVPSLNLTVAQINNEQQKIEKTKKIKKPKLPEVPPIPKKPNNLTFDLKKVDELDKSGGSTFVQDSLNTYNKSLSFDKNELIRKASLFPLRDYSSIIASTNNADSNANDSSNRYLQAYHHVRIFSDSMQAVCDSLFYSAKDSIFRLFTKPILWANGSQITGDTIYLYTKNKKADRLYVFENGLVINKVGNNLFNQIKGTTLNGYFKDGVIDYMRAKGNAESIYYAQDDQKAFFGVNQSKASIIDMIFLNKELNKVVLRNDAEGTMTPIKKVNFDDMRLPNFKWQDNLRPKSKYELFGN